MKRCSGCGDPYNGRFCTDCQESGEAELREKDAKALAFAHYARRRLARILRAYSERMIRAERAFVQWDFKTYNHESNRAARLWGWNHAIGLRIMERVK